MADVFLSYRNTEDRRALVARLAVLLRAYEIKVWWDYGLAAGASYRDQIVGELESARIVIPLWCSQSVVSKWVLLEAKLGKDKLFPARLQYCKVPAEFEPIQAHDLIGWNGSANHPRFLDFARKICERLGKKALAPADSIEQLLHLPPVTPLPERVAPTVATEEQGVSAPTSPGNPMLDDLRRTWANFPARDDRAVVARFLERVRKGAPETGLELEVEIHLHALDGKRDAKQAAAPSVARWSCIKTLIGHKDQVLTAAFSADGKRVVTASFDYVARIWDVGAGSEIAALKAPHDWLYSAALSPDGGAVLVASKNPYTLDAKTGRQLKAFLGHSAYIVRARYAPDGQRIITASMDGTAKIWDAATGKALHTLAGHSKHLSDATFSPDGKRAATASLDGTVKIWDAESGVLVRTIVGHGTEVVSAAFSPDGKFIAVASSDRGQVWDAASGEPLVWLKGQTEFPVPRVHPSGFVKHFYRVCYSPDGRHILTTCVDPPCARIFDAASGEMLAALGHVAPLWSADYSPDGTMIVTASADKAARIWRSGDVP